MTLRFHSRARLDVFQAISWYENEQRGLGKRFNEKLIEASHRISDSPFEFPVAFEDFRRARLGGTFPFSIVFTIADDVIYILAVVHDKRNPDFWKTRV